MTIATYSDLQAAIGNWLDHSLFAARVPEFIALFEAAANRRLRVRQQEITASLVLPSGNDQSTKVLLHFDGAQGSTAILDTNAGGAAKTWAATADAHIDTAQS